MFPSRPVRQVGSLGPNVPTVGFGAMGMPEQEP